MKINILEKVKGKDGYLILVDTGVEGSYNTLMIIQDFEGCSSVVGIGNKELPSRKVSSFINKEIGIYDFIENTYMGVPLGYNMPIVRKLFDNACEQLKRKGEY